MYRAIGLYALRAGKDPKENDAVNALLPQIELRLASIEAVSYTHLDVYKRQEKSLSCWLPTTAKPSAFWAGRWLSWKMPEPASIL